MAKWTGLDKPITAADAEHEPLHERLDFTKRLPSLVTARALRRAEQPELLASDMRQLKARRRPRAA